MWRNIDQTAEHFGVTPKTVITAIGKYKAAGSTTGAVIRLSKKSGYRIDVDKLAKFFDASNDTDRKGWRPKTA